MFHLIFQGKFYQILNNFMLKSIVFRFWQWRRIKVTLKGAFVGNHLLVFLMTNGNRGQTISALPRPLAWKRTHIKDCSLVTVANLIVLLHFQCFESMPMNISDITIHTYWWPEMSILKFFLWILSVTHEVGRVLLLNLEIGIFFL